MPAYRQVRVLIPEEFCIADSVRLTAVAASRCRDADQIAAPEPASRRVTEQALARAGVLGRRGGRCCRRPRPGGGDSVAEPGPVGSRSARRGRVVAWRIEDLN